MAGADGAPYGFALVASEIVDDHDVAGLERGHQYLLDISEEALAVDRTIDDAGGIDPVATQRGKEGQCSPATLGDFRDQSLTAWRTPVRARHVGLGPGLIDEDQAGWVKLALIALPLGPSSCHVGTILLAGAQAFF